MNKSRSDGRHFPLFGRPLWALGVLAAVAACSPNHDWRVLRPEGSGFEALFPCRAAYEERVVRLADAQVKVGLHACSAGDVTYAVLTATLPTPAAVPRALEELAQSSRRNIAAAASTSGVAATVPGATPQPGAVALSLAGKLPDGAPVQMRSVVVARGMVVVQSSMVGPKLDASHADTFFESQRFASP